MSIQNYKNLTAQQIIDIYPKKVQYRYIKDQIDSLPKQNERYWGDIDHLIAVAIGIKPIAVISYKLIEKLSDKHYSKKQVKDIIKLLNNKIYYIPNISKEDKIISVIIFQDKNKDYALVEKYMNYRDSDNEYLLNESEEYLYSRLIDILYGYEKDDIIEGILFYNEYFKRDKIKSMNDLLEIKNKLYKKYEKEYKEAKKLMPKLIERCKNLEHKYNFLKKNIKEINKLI
jgi:hypothetical protein